MPTPIPLRINVPDHILTDLQDRLARTRFLPDSHGRPPSGMTADYLQELTSSWQSFDWRTREAWLNAHPQFTVQLEDVDLHFVHLRSEDADAPALLVMHGWPHTFALQLDFADLLPDFHVVVVSLPGFGFSSAYRTGTWNIARVSDTMHLLMTDVLGYEGYLTYGEDVSANINDYLAATHPEHVTGIIATHAHFPSSEEQALMTAPDELAFFARLNQWWRDNGGYSHMQRTRPDTLAAGLNDSPAGLLAWIVEKLVEWSDTPLGDPRMVERRFSRDRILTEAMIYWITESIATSFAPYFHGEEPVHGYPPVTVPASVHIQRHEWDYPEAFASRYYRDLRRFERLDDGGHFAIAEVPAAMADRVRTFAIELGLIQTGNS